MILVKNLLGMCQVKIVLSQFIPREIYKKFYILVLDIIIWRVDICPFKLPQFRFKCVSSVLWPLFTFCFEPQFVDVRTLRIYPKLLLDGFELIVQVVLPLLLIHLCAYFLLNIIFQCKDIHLPVENLQQFHCPYFHVTLLEKSHFFKDIVYVHT